MARVVELGLGEVVADRELHPRVSLDRRLVEHYAQLIEEGVELPPVRVARKGDRYFLLDGFHRYHAHLRAGRATIRAVVCEVPEGEWFYHACLWNSRHGKRLTPEDMRRAAEKLYGQGYSTEEIARALGCSRRWANELLREVKEREREKVAELYSKGLSPREIAGKLGLKLETVEKHIGLLSTLEVTSNVDTPLKEKALELLREGKSLRETARALGVSHETVRRWARERVRELGRRGMSAGEISRETGVRVSVVERWLEPEGRERPGEETAESVRGGRQLSSAELAAARRESAYDPASLVPVEWRGAYLCPLCDLKLALPSLEAYARHLASHHRASPLSVFEALRRAQRPSIARSGVPEVTGEDLALISRVLGFEPGDLAGLPEEELRALAAEAREALIAREVVKAFLERSGDGSDGEA